MKDKKIILEVSFQIIIMIGMTFAFSYFMHESLESQKIIYEAKKRDYGKYGIILKIMGFAGKMIFNEKSFVSALTEEEARKGAFTCLKDKEGKICQTAYTESECSAKCAGECLPARPEEISACSLGTCYNPGDGKCDLGTPKELCEEKEGKWFNDASGNIQECKQGCCVLGGDAYLGTAKQCERDASIRGLKKDFRPEANTEISCIALAETQEEGACVFQEDFENGCKFTTKLGCLQTIKGKFYSGMLCSNPELKTRCKSQQTVKCAENKDEVYWYDSCGNRENIYDANKVKSFNNGKILDKSESCSLNSGSNPFANQGKCGNCNYLLGSICGKKTSNEKLSDGNFDFVCKDLSCIDKDGKKRKHGESWCEYQGAIGVDKNRGADTPGSRDFRKTCINGEIKIDACADYRNEICVESQTNLPDGGKFSSAACRVNLAYTCYGYNQKGKQGQCEKNPDCFIKKVDISKNFKFDFCVPKYKPGFDLETRGEGAETICKIGSQNCKVIYVKEFNFLTKQGEWKCKANCECEKAAFAEKMNDFCMSLGDCGAQANYQGTLGENYKVKNSPKLGNTYLAGIKRYADEKQFKGQFAQPGEKFFSGELGIPGILGSAQTPQDETAAMRKMLSLPLGAIGTVLPAIAATHAGAGILSHVGLAFNPAGPEAAGINPSLSATGGAIAGAAIGFAVTAMLLDLTGVGRGLSPIITYSLLVAGAVAGAIILANGGAILGVVSIVPIVGWIIAAVVIVTIIYFSLIGIGKVKKITVSFTCQPWQAQTGGQNCQKCGQDGFPCSKYACQSLGQTCQYINEETGNPECIAIEANDSSAPEIRAMKELLPSGYTGEESDLGIKIKSKSQDGCIQETFQAIPFGAQLNEPGQCRMEFNHTNSFDEMEDFDLSGRSMFLRNHTIPLIIPSVESLGLEGFDPNSKIDYNIYIRCQDKSGNKNEKEYNINFCIKQGPDTTPAIVAGKEPFSDTIAFNSTDVNATIFTNEPAECKWEISDTDYNLMGNSFECANDIEDRKLQGWACNSVLPIKNNENKFYVRCLDQPWLKGANESARNPNKESYELKYKRSSSSLKIDSASPDNETLIFAAEPASVNFNVATSGGLDGTSRCTYTLGDTTDEFRYGAWTNSHRQNLQALFSGEYEIPIKCEDIIGNTVEKNLKFAIKIDAEAPRVSRVYKQNGALVVITNEEASCYYSLDNREQCLFDINNKTISQDMSGQEFIHNLASGENDKIYIKCKDKLGNYPGECSIIIKEGGV